MKRSTPRSQTYNLVSFRSAPHRPTGTHLKALLPVLVLLQEIGKVDDDLSVSDLELKDLVVDGLGGVDCANRLLEIDVEGPQLERLEKASLRGEGLQCKVVSG